MPTVIIMVIKCPIIDKKNWFLVLFESINEKIKAIKNKSVKVRGSIGKGDKMIRLKSILTSFAFLMVFQPYVSWAMIAANACLHPLEEAALLYGNQQEDPRSQIESTEEQIEGLEERIEALMEGEDRVVGINEWIDRLTHSLDERESYNQLSTSEGETGTEAVAHLISDYIQSKQDRLEEEQRGLWENDRRYFKSNGRIDDKFCEDHATANVRDCKNALQKLRQSWERVNRISNQIEQLEERLEELDEQAFEREFGEGSTEADGLCFECLDEIRALNRPTAGQTVGNILSLVAGGAISYYGYRAGQRSVGSTNNLRVQQGYSPVSSAGPAWAGASLGLPFISNGVYGLANGNSQIGNYSCSPGAFSQYGQGGPGGPWANAGFGGGFGPGFGGGFGGGFGPGFGGGFGGGFGPGFGGGFGAGFGPGFGGGFGPGFGGGFGPGFGGGFGGGLGPGGLQAQFQQQQYAQYLQFQQQQTEARLQAQQAWIQQQQAIQQDRIQRQQVISGLTQEIGKIQQQISMVAYGGIGSSGLTGSASLSAGLTIGSNTAGITGTQAPQTQTPAPTVSPDNTSGSVPYIDSR